ncbi:hypothetical protein MFRU_019g00320 [Monilinia fructicola]|nr:hypothetical protein MFRU_019g00320 [Monilinia fructicola]
MGSCIERINPNFDTSERSVRNGGSATEIGQGTKTHDHEIIEMELEVDMGSSTRNRSFRVEIWFGIFLTLHL